MVSYFRRNVPFIRYSLRLCQDASYFSSCKSSGITGGSCDISVTAVVSDLIKFLLVCSLERRWWALLPCCCFINSSASVCDLFFTRSKATRLCEMRRKWETFWFASLRFLQACGSDFLSSPSRKFSSVKTTPTLAPIHLICSDTPYWSQMTKNKVLWERRMIWTRWGKS